MAKYQVKWLSLILFVVFTKHQLTQQFDSFIVFFGVYIASDIFSSMLSQAGDLSSSWL